MRRVVLLHALALIILGAISCQATTGETEVPDETHPSHVFTATLTASPTGTSAPTATRTETPTPTPSFTPQPTHTPTFSPTPVPTSTPTPLPATATVTPPRRSDCPPDVACLRIVNQGEEPLIYNISVGGVSQEISIDGRSAHTMHVQPGQHQYTALTEVSGCMAGGQGMKDRYCARLNTRCDGTVRVQEGQTSELVFIVVCQQWDGVDCVEPTLTLAQTTQPAPTPTIGPPTPTATATPVCECPANVACLTVENNIGDLLTVEIAGSGIAQVMQIDPHGQGTLELPAGRYEYAAHTRTGHVRWCVFDRCDTAPAGPIYLCGNVDVETGLCHRLAITVSCGWWDEGLCFDPVLVVAE
jgi:hypothetical protein